MPTMPPTLGSNGQSKQQRRRVFDQQRRAAKPWRKWYSTARWRRIRAKQLADNPLCKRCEARGEVAAATVCDHRERHNGDPDLFWNGPFDSLCKPCHDGEKQREENAAQITL